MRLNAAKPSSEKEGGVKVSGQGILSCQLAFLNVHQPGRLGLPSRKNPANATNTKGDES